MTKPDETSSPAVLRHGYWTPGPVPRWVPVEPPRRTRAQLARERAEDRAALK